MAVASGMNYSGMESIVTLIENRIKELNQYFEILSSDVVSKIASAYSGEAADAYQKTLSQVAEQMNTDLNDLITSLKTAITETQSKYAAQDAQMASSVANVSTSAGNIE